MPATIAWVSEGEQARPRRRRGRRRGKRAAAPADSQGQSSDRNSDTNKSTAATNSSTATNSGSAANHSNAAANTGGAASQSRPRKRSSERLRTVHETSAGGLVVDGLDDPTGSQVAALIGRVDRRGRMLWSLPKGHIELGETAEQTAIREVAEETGIRGDVLASLGSIDYWFVTEGRRVHKTVHHYLLRFLGGELSDDDMEVSEVAWVPLDELPSRLAYADERRLAEVADKLIHTLHTHGAAALPPLPHSTPWRRRQTHSATRRRPRGESGSGRANGHGRP
jgi:8-oxo-dGTP pyrophosphatase MutT (NUDIX family)